MWIWEDGEDEEEEATTGFAFEILSFSLIFPLSSTLGVSKFLSVHDRMKNMKMKRSGWRGRN